MADAQEGNLLECLTRQVDELLAVQATFPEPGAVVLGPVEQDALLLAQRLVAGDAELGALDVRDVPQLGGTIRPPGLELYGQAVGLRFTLPLGYPDAAAAPPALQPECAGPRHVHERLSAALQRCAEQESGAECLLAAVEALKDEVSALLQAAADAALGAGGGGGDGSSDAGRAAAANGAGPSGPAPLERTTVVIWFHHIKSLTKRKNIVAWARELQLGGACKPGFPGLIIAQGLSEGVRELVARIRALSWQAMQVRAEETCQVDATISGGGGGGDAAKPSCNAHRDKAAAATQQGQAHAAPQHGNGQDGLAAAAPAAGTLQPPFVELDEGGMSELGALCAAAGLQHLFLAALKIRQDP